LPRRFNCSRESCIFCESIYCMIVFYCILHPELSTVSVHPKIFFQLIILNSVGESLLPRVLAALILFSWLACVSVGYVKCALSRVTLDLRIMLVALEERFFISGTLSCEHQSANHMHNSKDAHGSHHQQVRTGFPPPHFVAARTSLSIISPKRIICGFSKNRGQSVCVCLRKVAQSFWVRLLFRSTTATKWRRTSNCLDF
jgi:hypothetical protein